MSPPRQPRSSPPLVEDAVGEILLRLPPGDPAGLVRASAVCRTWRRILTDPDFPGRYRAFHGTPPLLGFLQNHPDLAQFVPTTAFRPAVLEHHCGVLDCRHGRVLLVDGNSAQLIVWDPITGAQRRLPDLPDTVSWSSWNASVLCAAGAGCDHRGCSEGPFLVAVVGIGHDENARACLYSSETGAWSAPTSSQLELYYYGFGFCVARQRAALAGNATYFLCDFATILRYDLGDRSLSLIHPPNPGYHLGDVVIMPAEDGGLGLANLYHHNLHLCLWSRETRPDGVAGWVQSRAIDLETLLRVRIRGPVHLVGYADASNVIFVRTYDDDVFTIDLKSFLTAKLCGMDEVVDYTFPYTSFYTPACASGRLASTSGSP